MMDRRQLRSHLVLLAGLAATSPALGNPFTSSAQANWRKLEQNSNATLKTYFQPSTCRAKFVAKKGGSWVRHEMDVRKWVVQGSYVRCKNGGACIKASIRSTASGASWSTPASATQFAKADALPLDMTFAQRCSPGVRSAPSGTTWKYRGGDPTAGAAKKISISGNRRHATDSTLGGLGICRVQLLGAGYLGTVHNTTQSAVWVHNGTKFVQKTVSGERTVCTVQIDQHQISSTGTGTPPDFRGGRSFFNFEYLYGNIQERHWTTNSLSRGVKAANIDGVAARICLRAWTEKKYNQTQDRIFTGNFRGFGFRKPGSTWCYTARHKQARGTYSASQGESFSSRVRLLKK